ncbi:hypothetical protein [Streptomyces sp. NBC_01373]|uniref:hypothetical protein n=1 Tax=Streptomyces sp. NBC_01373 TaxID=2903843 RepID=UPI002259D14E|nr:hypothetical protein [Streptomyces sp. NBC_01373]MCX4698999.1 hypothetical protein [Streptomyces sp. NBC_01373]
MAKIRCIRNASCTCPNCDPGPSRWNNVVDGVVIGATAVTGSIVNAGLPPTTDTLDDAGRIGRSHYETAIDEAGHQQGTNTSQF